ncbi:hypothetical protein [Leisingera sp. ANG59]|uniref:hypothetical protein n=1 Tax=Leisingera sp. ANG59 TaxID=2675221 RepID=UPI001571E75E|nr:hypothetical protein [Leisingera sp. ANG59]NSY36858.1 hypothetical protein [Leisingera sp. ANG59]
MNIFDLAAAFLSKISASLVFAALFASSYVLFCPSLPSELGSEIRAVSGIVFVFALAWLGWTFLGWVKTALEDNRSRKAALAVIASKAEKRTISVLQTDILFMVKRFSGLSGMLARRDNHPQAAAQISDKYARLEDLGVQTPEIDLAAADWEFDLHCKFLTMVSSFLGSSDIVVVRQQAAAFLASR